MNCDCSACFCPRSVRESVSSSLLTYIPSSRLLSDSSIRLLGRVVLFSIVSTVGSASLLMIARISLHTGDSCLIVCGCISIR